VDQAVLSLTAVVVVAQMIVSLSAGIDYEWRVQANAFRLTKAVAVGA
jgi:hypothetical protein